MDRDKFAQVLREGYDALDPEKEEREYIRELLRKKEQQRKRRIRTITAAAAAFILVVGAVLAVGGCFAPAEADKNSRTKVEEHNGSAVIKGENTEDEEIGPEIAKVTDWDGIAELKEQYPEMITFTDVPDGMEFVSVEVKDSKNISFRAVYSYTKDGENVFVCQRINRVVEQETEGLEIAGETINYNGYEIYINDNENIKEATIVYGYEIINIIGAISNKEIVHIMDRIKASN